MPSLMTLFKKDPAAAAQAKPKNEMANVFPVEAVEGDYFKTKDGRYCTLLSVSPVNMSLLSADDTDRVVEAVQEAANTIQDRIQVCISSERLNLDDYLHYLQGFIDTATDTKQLEDLLSMQEEIRTRSIGNEKVLKFYIAITSQFDKEAPAIAELADLAKQIEDTLKQEGIYIHRLTKPETMALWYQKLNPQASLVEPATRDMELQHIFPPVIDFKSPALSRNGYYQVEEMFMKSYTIEDFPQTRKFASWLSPIVEMPLDIDLTITMVATDKEAIMTYMNKSIRAIRAAMEEATQKKDLIREKKLKAEYQSADRILDQLANDNETFFNTTFVITIRETSLEQLRHSEKILRTKIAGQKMKCKALLHRSYEPLWYTLPICYKGEMEKTVRYGLPANIIGSLQPFNSSSLVSKTGIVLGMNQQSHDLIIYGDEMRARYPHMILIGETGSGKSFELYSIIGRRLALGENVLDLDPERERESIPGNHIYFGLNHRFTVNPFHIRSTVVDTDNERANESSKPGDYLRLKIDRNKAFFRWIYPNMNAVEAAAIDTAQIKAYENAGLTFESETLPDTFPTLSEFASVLETLPDTDRLCLALSPYHGKGTYSRMFDGQTNWSFTESQTVDTVEGQKVMEVPFRYTRLDIHELPEDAQPMLMTVLLNDMWEFVKLDRNVKKNLVCDEFWILSDPENPHTLNFVFQMIKRGRKYGVHMIPATQNVNDLLRTKPGTSVAPGQAIISGCGVKILLPLDKEEVTKISQFVELSEKEKKVLLTKGQRGHGILLVGTQHAEIQTFMTKAEMKQYDPNRYKLLYELVE